MEFPPAAQWAKDALAAYRNGLQRGTQSPRAPLIFVNDLGPDEFKDIYPLAPSDTDQIIADYKRQLRFPPPGINKGRILYQLANAYRRRWLESARSEDLDDAVLALWYSLLNTPQGSLETKGTLEEFCYLLHRRFDGTGRASEIHKRNFGDELFLSRLLEVSTELENMIERRRMSTGIQQQQQQQQQQQRAPTEGAHNARFRRYQHPEVDDYPARPRRRADDYYNGVDDRPSASRRDRQTRETVQDDVDDRPSAPLRRATERIFASFGKLLDKVLPDDASSTTSRSSSSFGE